MTAFEEPAHNEFSAGEAAIRRLKRLRVELGRTQKHAGGAETGTWTKATWKKNTAVGVRQNRAGRSLGLSTLKGFGWKPEQRQH